MLSFATHQKQVVHWVQSVILSMKLAVFVDLSRKRGVFMAGKVTNNKKRHPRKDVSKQAHHNKELQRRVIRVSEMFAEHRSSGDARSDRRE